MCFWPHYSEIATINLGSICYYLLEHQHWIVVALSGKHFLQSMWVSQKPLYLSPCLIVMQVHQAAWGLFNLAGIHKSARELNAVLDVSRAASPLPAFLLIVIPLLLPVAAALAQVSLAARCCDSMGHPCCCDGVGESCFPTAWKREKRCFWGIRL